MMETICSHGLISLPFISKSEVDRQAIGISHRDLGLEQCLEIIFRKHHN